MLEALRYRAEDVSRGITKAAVAEARSRELRSELLNSEKLKAHFEENPNDLAVLKHDKPLHKVPHAAHLKHIPSYLRVAKGASLGRSSIGQGGRPSGAPSLSKKAKKLGALDPLKAAKPSFVRGGNTEELTVMEKRALEKGKKEARKEAKKEAKRA